MYEVIKTIGGRRYRYLQRSYRENGRVRTQSRYLGPVDGVAGGTQGGDKRKRRVKAAIDALAGLAKRGPEFETATALQRRMTDETAARAKQDRINDLLTAPTISLASISEIAAAQSDASEMAAASEKSVGPSEGPSEGSIP